MFATIFTRGEDGARLDETGAMDEKSRIDNELFQQKKKAVVAYLIKSRKTLEERREVEQRAAEVEVEATVQRL